MNSLDLFFLFVIEKLQVYKPTNILQDKTAVTFSFFENYLFIFLQEYFCQKISIIPFLLGEDYYKISILYQNLRTVNAFIIVTNKTTIFQQLKLAKTGYPKTG